MTLELEINKTISREKKVVEEVQITRIKVNSVFLDLDSNTCTAILSLGHIENPEDPMLAKFVKQVQYKWDLCGNYYVQKISENGLADMFHDKVKSIVNEIESNDELKQQLIDEKDLVITEIK